MRVRFLLSATMLTATAAVPCLALKTPLHHTQHTSRYSTRHADIRHAALHSSGHATGHHSLHTVVAHHEAAPAISDDRATQIQTALIKKGYLTGEPTGTWDASTAAAMVKLQSDNGWQTKVVPDSRALIKLGLGPAPVEPGQTVSAVTPPQP
jgi:hypothetical protein